jgi:hypothetical protein
MTSLPTTKRAAPIRERTATSGRSARHEHERLETRRHGDGPGA